MSNLVRKNTWFQRFSVAFTTTGDPPIVLMEVMAASQTLKVGDPVTKAAGVITKGTDTSGQIYGVCLGAAVTTAANEGTQIPVAVADRNTVFVAQANGATNTIADGAECDIVSSGNTWKLEINASTEDVAKIVKHVPGDDITDATYPGRLYFIWVRSQWDNLVAAQA